MKRLPEARLRIIPDCGHLPHIEKSELVYSIISEFGAGSADENCRVSFDALSPLDVEAAAKHRSTWVSCRIVSTIRQGAEEYEAYIDFLVDSERLGFDAISVNEHHQTAYGMMPAPN